MSPFAFRPPRRPSPKCKQRRPRMKVLSLDLLDLYSNNSSLDLFASFAMGSSDRSFRRRKASISSSVTGGVVGCGTKESFKERHGQHQYHLVLTDYSSDSNIRGCNHNGVLTRENDGDRYRWLHIDTLQNLRGERHELVKNYLVQHEALSSVESFEPFVCRTNQTESECVAASLYKAILYAHQDGNYDTVFGLSNYDASVARKWLHECVNRREATWPAEDMQCLRPYLFDTSPNEAHWRVNETSLNHRASPPKLGRTATGVGNFSPVSSRCIWQWWQRQTRWPSDAQQSETRHGRTKQ